MVTINRVSPEAMLAAHARAGRKHRPDPGGVRPEPRAANVQAVRELESPPPLPFRGRMYRTRPVSFDDGLLLLEMGEAATEEVGGRGRASHYRREIRRAMQHCWRIMQPRWARYGLWRLRPNPLLRASLPEVRDILAFFGQLQTTSPAPSPNRTAGGNRPRTS
jgi:hypothetical protein